MAVSVPLCIEGGGCCPLDGTADVTGAGLEQEDRARSLLPEATPVGQAHDIR